ncbi:hypothetical protein CNBD1140 [Cryptococcus deneoformans B-3501A]|uniref:hypothetical protein n=1 Tax=Cryptococcus deneoformans (strain B-3501A) TaxID=283643 RepID=UPI000042FB99|nr:hypothetical protein CNBD1140 [Cryptococcus neoformans var. neoformans B-3501A]EAL21419.1 hypothetical protein CNBD1140 [Cryptococcus neoformans var. neoformans B-3501A]
MEAAPPRPSTSSSRSLRRTPADFEAALRNPQETLYLSAGPPPIGEDLESEAASTATGHHHSSGTSTAAMDDPDAPLSVDKRSFEDDLRALSRTREREEGRIGLGVGHVSEGSVVKRPPIPVPGVTPPTPKGHARKASCVTTTSTTSTGTGDTPTRAARRPVKSIGLDAELGIEPKSKKAPPKRRSLFSKATTTSQPDLASMVRRSTHRSSKQKQDTASTPAPSMSTSASSRTLYKEQPSPSAPRNRSTTETSDKHGSMMGGNQMATIAEGSGTLSRNKSNASDEGFKTMKYKARGMFGKMFGSTKEDQQLSSKHSGSASSSRVDINAETVYPPVPPVPATYANQKQRPFTPSSTSTDVFSPSRSPQLSTYSASASPAMASHNRKSRTPTPSTMSGRRDSQASAMITDKPLPAVRDNVDDHDSTLVATITKRGSSPLHVREPASVSENETPSRATSCSSRKLAPSPSPATAAVTSFSDDMAGMLANIGQSQPAMELGLPQESLRLRDGKNGFPAALGRPLSDQELSVTPTSSTFLSATSSPQRSASVSAASASDQASSMPLKGSSADQLSSFLDPPIFQSSTFLNHELYSLHPQQPQNRHHTEPFINLHAPSPSLSSALAPSVDVPQIAPIFEKASDDQGEKDWQSLSEGPSPLLPSSAKFDSSGGVENTDRPSPIAPSAWARQAQGSPSSPLPSPARLQSNLSDKIDRTCIPASSSAMSGFSSLSAQGTIKDTRDKVEVISSPPETPSKAQEQAVEVSDDKAESQKNSEPDREQDKMGEGSNEDKGKRLAREFYEGDGTTVAGDKMAEFLGGPHAINDITLKYFMQYFHMEGQNLVDAFRQLCQKLYLKAESQELDRIMGAFSARFFECNPNTVFGSPGILHTVSAAMLMLNTDLHIAELSRHMSKAEFVRNTLQAIHESTTVDPNTILSAAADERSSTPDLVRDDDGSSMKPSLGSNSSMSTTLINTRAKTPIQPMQARSTSAPVISAHIHQHAPPYASANSSLSVAGISTEGKSRNSSFSAGSWSYSKGWETGAEAALKEIYSSVRADKILLPISGIPGNDRNASRSSNRQSMISLASNGPYDSRPYGSQWYGSDGRLSPALSNATSINETGASGSGFSSFAPSLGFASNLSHTVIRENEDEVGSLHSKASVGTVEDMDDDELALLGAPWAKEGILQRRTQGEGVAKRVKKADWKQFFVVVSKGDLYMFTFGDGKGGGGFMGGSVGGGNWLENANANGTINLMHTTAVALPKQGHSSSKPYCFSVNQSSGEVCTFAAGTEDLVAEWVATCNYWAARKTRQPLQGGVSNMEYGWNRVAVDQLEDESDRMSVFSQKSNGSRMGGTYGRRALGSGGGSSTGQFDKIHINDWKPPPPAMIPSTMEEEGQLEALVEYVKSQEKELEKHKAVEEPMMRLYSHGSKNLHKAKENWKAKSHYIHSEIFKYETYIDALRNAISLRAKKQGEKKLEKSLAMPNNNLQSSSGDKSGALDKTEKAVDASGAAQGVNAGGLSIDPEVTDGQFDDDGEEQPITPNATIRR